MIRRTAAAAVALLLLATHVAAQDTGPPASAARVKAAFLLKFCAYIDWGKSVADSAAKPLVIGVMGDDDVADELADLVPGRAVLGRPVAAKKLQADDPVAGVDMLFIGSELGSRTGRVARDAARKGVLVVTDGREGLLSGSVINFVLANDRVGFEVSLKAAERSGHGISSRMLAVARRVVKEGG